MIIWILLLIVVWPVCVRQLRTMRVWQYRAAQSKRSSDWTNELMNDWLGASLCLHILLLICVQEFCGRRVWRSVAKRADIKRMLQIVRPVYYKIKPHCLLTSVNTSEEMWKRHTVNIKVTTKVGINRAMCIYWTVRVTPHPDDILSKGLISLKVI